MDLRLIKKLTFFKFDPTTTNVSQRVTIRPKGVAKRMQHVAVKMLPSFGWGLRASNHNKTNTKHN